MTKKILILYEHASGYALLKCKINSISELLEQIKGVPISYESLKDTFDLVAFSPFTSAVNALDNCNSISEGLVHEDLKGLLLENVKSKISCLYVFEKKIADSIRGEDILPENVACQYDGESMGVYRVLKSIFPDYIKDLTHFNESKAQVGLGHSYSRSKVKFNVNRSDNMIIQTICLLDQIDKDINTFSMRIKEWFSYHFPELSKIIPNNADYVNVVGMIKSRDGINEETVQEMMNLLNDEDKVNCIVESAKTSVGFDITEEDHIHLASFTSRVMSLINRRKHAHEYLLSKMSGVAPNLSTLIGDQVAARLISHAGSLTNLAKFPASTIQILGAEKALFRALKRRCNTPKYGLIFHSSFIGRASRENKGRISRFLAAKCALACRIDCFSDVLCNVYGKHLHQQIEDRLEYFHTGNRPITNREAMKVAVQEADQVIKKIKKKAIKTLQKAAKRKAEEEALAEENSVVQEIVENGNSEPPKKKKKKSKHNCE